jgi:hypothetical protein
MASATYFWAAFCARRERRLESDSASVLNCRLPSDVLEVRVIIVFPFKVDCIVMGIKNSV